MSTVSATSTVASASPHEATITIAPDFTIGEVDPRLFGAFLEHLGRAIYSGIYEPGHPTADADGFRQDVLEVIRTVHAPVMRYPGGNFVSGYNWEDGVGPVAARPHRLELAWKSTETNAFGTNEFIAWCKKAQTEPILAVNLGTRGPDEARNLVEYCNHPGGTYWSDLRRSHGYAEPHNVRYWCLGNEMDGSWQMCYKTAEEYGRVATEAAKLMHWTDPRIEMVACGSSGISMTTFADWETTVLNHTYNYANYLSLHTYYGKPGEKTTGDFLAESVGMDTFIDTVVSICDFVKAKKRSKKTMMLAFDEWNVWYHTHASDATTKPWQEAPPIAEDIYTMEDALVVGSMILSLLRHADRVKIGCIAQLVNVIAPIMTVRGGVVWKQPTFYPYQQASIYGVGNALRTIVHAPTYHTTNHGDVSLVDAQATHDPATGAVTVFVVNRHETETMPLTVNLRAFVHDGQVSPRLVEHTVLAHADKLAVNGPDTPDNVHPTTDTQTVITDGTLSARLAPLSWNVIRLQTTV